MMLAIGVILSLAFLGWLIWLAVKKRPIKAYMVMYTLASLTGVFTIAFFLSMNIDQVIKILISIVLGAVLIFLAAYFQRRQASRAE